MLEPEIGKAADLKAWGLERPGLGLALGGVHSVEQLDRHRDWVDLAEALGLHSLWLPEMHFSPGVCPAPLLELAGFAARTERIRLGTTSLLLPLHPAEEVAAEIAALDRLSGGRLLVGLGRGFQKRMLEAFGVDPATKRDRFDESLEAMRSLWAESNAAGGRFSTLQEPHPPLAVAAFGPKGLAQAARHGLPYLASPVESSDQIAQNQERHRELTPEGCAPPLSLLMRTVFVSESEAACAAVREGLAREARERRGPKLPKAIEQAMATPLEARSFIGDPKSVTERLVAERQRLGIDLLIVRPTLSGADPAALEVSLRVLAEQVWPDVIQRTT